MLFGSKINVLGLGHRVKLALFTLLSTVLISCGGGGGGGTSATYSNTLGTSVVPDTSVNPYGLAAKSKLASLSFPLQPALGDLTLTDSLYSVDRGILMLPSPVASNTLMVLQQPGVVLMIDAATGNKTPFLDLSSKVSVEGEQGLIGMTFDPNYSSNHYFYLHYSQKNGGVAYSYVSRFTANNDFTSASLSSEQIVFQATHATDYHNGGSLAFGNDGYLYIALGDDHDGANSQDLSSYFGKILRIDPNNSANGQNYAVPSDNPYVDTAGAKPEIWAIGFRNPYKMAIDTDGTIWVGDVGEDTYEELDIVVKKGNYGWPYYEGAHATAVSTPLPASTFTAPYFEYSHADGQCIIAGFVYHGSAIPRLVGQFIFGDFVQGKVYALKKNSDGSFNQTLISSNTPYITGFGLDSANEIYTLDSSGSVRQIISSGTTTQAAFPAHLSDTGLFTDVSSLQPQPGLIEYDVNSPLWSDNAIKRRWMAIPDNQKITFSPSGNWSFPVGTVLVKHFEMELTPGDTTTRKRLETRVLVNQIGNVWRGATYRWNSAQTDADLLETGADETLSIKDATASGGVRQQAYHYPTASECMACHTQAAGHVLGIRSEQLNKNFAYADATDNQLRTLNHIGLLSYDIGAPSQYPALSSLKSSVDTATKARSYLASNCSFCHQPKGPTPVNMDFRYATAQAQMNAVDVTASNNLGVVDTQIIFAGAKEKSALYRRMSSRSSGTQMPPLGSNIIDPSAINIIGQWIDGL